LGKSNYIDNALIRLKRQYGKDELVAVLIKEIKSKDIEIGKLKSEIDYLNDKFIQKDINKEALIQVRKEELYKQILERNAFLKRSIKSGRKLRDELLIKLNSK